VFPSGWLFLSIINHVSTSRRARIVFYYFGSNGKMALMSLSYLEEYFHLEIVSFLTLTDLMTLSQVCGREWLTACAVPSEMIWKRMIEHRNHHGDMTLFNPHETHTCSDFVFTSYERGNWTISVQILEHTLIGYNFIYDDDASSSIRALHKYNAICVRCPESLPDVDSNGKLLFTSIANHVHPAKVNEPFFASYSSFAVRVQVLDPYDVKQMEAQSFCVSTNGGSNALIIEEQDLQNVWETKVKQWIVESPEKDILVLLKKWATPSVYSIERIIVRI
jgi:hypothetical protein